MCIIKALSVICTRGEKDITTVFGTVVGGSSPSGCTINKCYKSKKLALKYPKMFLV